MGRRWGGGCKQACFTKLYKLACLFVSQICLSNLSLKFVSQICLSNLSPKPPPYRVGITRGLVLSTIHFLRGNFLGCKNTSIPCDLRFENFCAEFLCKYKVEKSITVPLARYSLYNKFLSQNYCNLGKDFTTVVNTVTNMVTLSFLSSECYSLVTYHLPIS